MSICCRVSRCQTNAPADGVVRRLNRMLAVLRWISLLALIPAITFAAESATPVIAVGSKFAATDTLACGDESSEDAKECLAKLSWVPTKFTVRIEAAQPGH